MNHDPPGERAGASARHEARIEQLVARAVAEFPDRIAAVDGSAAMSYSQLDRAADKLAGDLAAEGVKAGDLVGLEAPRSIGLVVGALGILRVGAAYVPMDPAYPRERLSFMIHDCGTRFVVEAPEGIGSATRLVLRPANPAGDGVDDLTTIVAAGAGPTHPTVPLETAYVIYTSGSTGRPKGVVVPHTGLVQLTEWHNAAFGIGPEDRAALVASPSFDASVWELWPYLVAGASVHIPDEETRRDPLALRDWLVAEGVTICFVPTGLAASLLNLSWPDTTRLRYLLTGGDALVSRPPAGLPFELVNNYGVTEASVVATSGVVTPDGDPGRPPSIGARIAPARLYVVDPDLRPVAEGDEGELLIGGDLLALGYLNQPQLSAERFVADHLSGSSDGRLFRTGDRVRQLPGGDFEFRGRLDDQVKIRGYRVECGEVAATILAQPGVAQCHVTATPLGSEVVSHGGANRERRLVAYLVAAEDKRLTDAELRANLAVWLPDWMLPDAIVWLPELPLSPNGKIDLQSLPAPSTSQRTLSEQDQPATELEEDIARMVAELLGLPVVGAEEDFFLLGGHSLMAAQLIALLSDGYGVEVSLKAVFEGPTVRRLAAEVESLVVAQLDSMSEEEAEQTLALPEGQAR